jgi:DNA-binding transcriptional regulator GbsR (MarR family)
MRTANTNDLGISPALLAELPQFESFLSKIGFKRLEGAVYGLLVLSQRPLTSEEIQAALGLSQSAVALALKTLTHYNAVETRDAREVGGDIHPRTKAHVARQEALTIVAAVFRKREQEAVEEYRRMAERLLLKSQKEGADEDSPRVKRMRSIIGTANIAEAVMDFVIELSRYENNVHYPKIVSQLPRFFHALIQGEKVAVGLTKSVHGEVKKHLDRALSPFRGLSEEKHEHP